MLILSILREGEEPRRFHKNHNCQSGNLCTAHFQLALRRAGEAKMINRTACVFGARAKRIVAHGLVIIALSFIVSSNLKAQGLAGIEGNVNDEQGAKVAGADVLLHSRSGIQLATTTDQTGAFEFRNLGSGAYLIEVKAPGFSVFSSDEISLEHGETKKLAIRLRVAVVSASVVVTATERFSEPTKLRRLSPLSTRGR